MSTFTRRLPVYLLLDCSGSMVGQPIEAVRQGVKALLADLRTDPQALETAHLGVITFNSTAQQVIPLTELLQFAEPQLDASGSTALGAALRQLCKAVDTEVRTSTPTQKGDWKPLVFLMTDGQPTDEWKKPAEEIRNKKVNIIACAAGSGADVNTLKQITETVVQLDTLHPDALKAFFAWISSSVKQTSQGVETLPAGAGIGLPPPPPQIRIVP